MNDGYSGGFLILMIACMTIMLCLVFNDVSEKSKVTCTVTSYTVNGEILNVYPNVKKTSVDTDFNGAINFNFKGKNVTISGNYKCEEE